MAPAYDQSSLIEIGKTITMISMMLNVPVCVLPCKNTIEELLYKNEGMSKR